MQSSVRKMKRKTKQDRKMKTTSKQASKDFDFMPSNRKLKLHLNVPKAVNKEMFQRVQDMAYHYSKEPPHWVKIYQPITIAADYMGVAILPRFQLNSTHHMQGTLCRSLQVLYDQVIKELNANGGVLSTLTDWKTIESAWSGCASFFRAYWFTHPHLDKKQAYLEALKLGKKSVTSNKK
jgi:hypothetical protein